MGKKTSQSSAEAKEGKLKASGKPGSPIGEPPLMKVLYTNADVLTSPKMMELKTLVDQTQLKIIGVVEVKPKNFRTTLTTQKYSIPNYNLELHGLGAEDSGRGVVVYIHKSLSYTRLEMECQDKFIPDVISCEIKLAGSDKLMFTCVYRSPSEHSDQNGKFSNRGLPLRITNVTGRIMQGISRHIHYSVWEIMLFEDILDNSHVAKSNKRGSLWNWGHRMLGTYWYRATLVRRMWGRQLSYSSNWCHGRDGFWEAMRITMVPWESLIFWIVWGTMGAGGKAYTSPKPSQDMERASTAQALSSG